MMFSFFCDEWFYVPAVGVTADAILFWYFNAVASFLFLGHSPLFYYIVFACLILARCVYTAIGILPRAIRSIFCVLFDYLVRSYTLPIAYLGFG